MVNGMFRPHGLGCGALQKTSFHGNVWMVVGSRSMVKRIPAETRCTTLSLSHTPLLLATGVQRAKAHVRT
jgi:hypothetical protein